MKELLFVKTRKISQGISVGIFKEFFAVLAKNSLSKPIGVRFPTAYADECELLALPAFVTSASLSKNLFFDRLKKTAHKVLPFYITLFYFDLKLIGDEPLIDANDALNGRNDHGNADCNA